MENYLCLFKLSDNGGGQSEGRRAGACHPGMLLRVPDRGRRQGAAHPQLLSRRAPRPAPGRGLTNRNGIRFISHDSTATSPNIKDISRTTSLSICHANRCQFLCSSRIDPFKASNSLYIWSTWRVGVSQKALKKLATDTGPIWSFPRIQRLLLNK